MEARYTTFAGSPNLFSGVISVHRAEFVYLLISGL